ncbi:hypothetical protein Tco_0894184 [Tanacetum coccineum]|uniref:Uncharacterized protein n=1 Tax=Tanacetum coccineum TaxID=301880 RepID=A0ABQ5CCI2_9ASTR
MISKESSFQEGECDGPPEPEWEGTISSFGGAIILPSITPVVKKARKALAKKNARDEEKPTLINILARPCAPMAPAICASAAPKQWLAPTLIDSGALLLQSLLIDNQEKKRRSTYSTTAFRRSNEEKNFSVRREAECSVIEAEDKEKGEREAILIVLVPPKGSVLDLVVKNLTETIFFALRNRSNYRCHTALCISGIFALDESRCTSVKPSKLPRIGRSNLECVRIFSPSIQHSKGHLVKAKTTYFASTEKRLASVRAKDQDVLSRAILPASINSFKP